MIIVKSLSKIWLVQFLDQLFIGLAGIIVKMPRKVRNIKNPNERKDGKLHNWIKKIGMPVDNFPAVNKINKCIKIITPQTLPINILYSSLHY